MTTLQALRLSQHEGRSSKRRIYDETVSIVFFGTPLNHTKQTPFKTAIRDCATIELSCSKRALDPTEEDIEYYAQLVQGVLNKRIHVVAVSESRKCQSSGTKSSWIPGRKKIVRFSILPSVVWAKCHLIRQANRRTLRLWTRTSSSWTG